jgi:hypothetical protein
MTAVTTAAIEPGTVLAGKLRVVRVLGAGGMGAVYEVEHQITKHRRALKLMHRGMALLVPDAVARFLREASAAGRIGNPHIVETFDAGELPSGEPYIVMEMLHGHSLAELIAHNGPLDLPTAVDILCQACAGVQAAHEAGIVHRDLKPDNLFVIEGPSPLVKVLDFGISKFDPERTGDPRMTAEGATMGTPSYMAPEQITGDGTVDARTDVYALGVAFYECLSAQLPYEGNSLPELALRIYEGHYTPLRQLRPNLPAEVDAILARTLVRDKDQRYATARELATALEQLVPPRDRSGIRPVISPKPLAAGRSAQLAAASHAGSALSDASVIGATIAVPGKRATLAIVLAALAVLVLGLIGMLAFMSREPVPAAVRPPASVPGAVRDHQTGSAAPRERVPLPTRAGADTDTLPVAPAAAAAVESRPPPSAATPRPAGTRPVVAPQPNAPANAVGPAAPDDKQNSRPHGGASRAREHGLAEDNPF